MKYILLFFIKIYQKTLSFDYGLMKHIFPGIRICIYTPSCSQYCYESIKKYGSIIGSFFCISRILRCNPWNKGGYDPVKKIKLKGFIRVFTKI